MHFYYPHEELPKGAILVVDAAYAEYATDSGYCDGKNLVTEFDNVVMLRTFSKIHGLAALRLGWCYGSSDIISILERVRGPFNVSVPAIMCGQAALADQDHVKVSIAHNSIWREKIQQSLVDMGYLAQKSQGNFILFSSGQNGEKGANHMNAYLQDRGLILRPMKSYGLPEWLRLTVGTEEQNQLFMKLMADYREVL